MYDNDEGLELAQRARLLLKIRGENVTGPTGDFRRLIVREFNIREDIPLDEVIDVMREFVLDALAKIDPSGFKTRGRLEAKEDPWI